MNTRLKRYSGVVARLLSFNNLLFLFFVVIIGGLVTLAFTFSRNNRNFSRSSYWVTHTHEVITQALQLSSDVKELQLENSNFLSAADAPALDKYRQLRTSIRVGVKRLRSLATDNLSEEKQIDKLATRIQEMIAFCDSSIENRQTGQYSDADLGHAARLQKHMRDAININIGNITTEELKLLKMREAVYANDVAAKNRYLYTALVILFLLLVGSLLLTLYHFHQQRNADDLMRASEARFRILVHSIRDFAIYMTDSEGRILNWYPGATQVKGYSSEDVVGKSMAIFYPPEAVAAGEPEHNLKMAAARGSYETEGWRVRKDGIFFWADVFISALYDDAHKLQGFTIVARDYSLHKKAEDEIKRALEAEKQLNEMKSNFVSIASHEFRTPLSTILSSVSLLEQYRTTETQDRRDRHIQRIKFSVRELVSVLDEFLSLEKLEEGKVYVKRRLINIREQVQQIGQEFQPILKPGQHIAYCFEGDEEVLMDPAFLRHMLSNLISNASKYSECDQPVEVSVRVADSKLELSVKDHGIGISHTDQSSLFGRFYRASNAGTIQGTGLGLHIVKRYVDLLGGIIQVTSELGKGSAFVITLPRLVTAEVGS